MPLTDAQRSHLEQRLRLERARATRVLSRSVSDIEGDTAEERAGDLSAMPTHMADLGTDTMEEELDASNATRISRELAEIDAALDRLYQDPAHFGVCERTGADIPFERLELIPWARTVADAAP